MQISFSRLPAGCKLNPASGLAIQNTQIYQCGMWLATNRMNFASGCSQPDANFAEISCQHVVKLLVFRKHAGTTFFPIKT
jgi:hypothetical protein